ncbi:hypothetical protein CKALI_07700 [Corynebacterium kalinowskii]|uniref:Uncharacterized protein n=1 Tax=Corynebacterium kalinowskii TaxID=2675216 RepID=A0A6B8VB84_9CORY|nr:hypothetical protein [Corynebacterium kalinowskii]QGU02402.1 hypothetical protein CKALI_07700 [Corynebacterium kalinowskii]
MSINDRIIERTENFYADEFEKAQANRSAVVTQYWFNYVNLALAPVLAWLLPREYSYVSYLVLIGPIIGLIAGNSWLKKSVARPKIHGLRYLWGWEWALMVAIIVAWLAGLFRAEGGDNWSYNAGAMIGALVGATAAIIAIPLVSGWQRRRDLKRLNAEAED